MGAPKRVAEAKKNALLIAQARALGNEGALPLSPHQRLEAAFYSPQAVLEAQLGPPPRGAPPGMRPDLQQQVERARDDCIQETGRAPKKAEWARALIRVRGLKGDNHMGAQLKLIERYLSGPKHDK